MTYPLTFYVKSLPPNVGGRANGPIIRIRPEYRNDKGIHAHEELHVKQWYFWVAVGICAAWLAFTMGSIYWPYALLAGCVVHPLLYALLEDYKLWCEVQCYREQMKHYSDDRSLHFAKFLATHYDFDITVEQALKLLKAT